MTPAAAICFNVSTKKGAALRMPTYTGSVSVFKQFFNAFRLAKSDFVERRFAADRFVVVGDFFKPRR